MEVTKSHRWWFAAIAVIFDILCARVLLVRAELLSTVTFDNKSGETALVKLVGPTAQAVEVPNGQSSTLEAAAGRYYILVRYGSDPNKYRYTKGEPFEVEEKETATAREYSKITITLHPVVGGNYSTGPSSKEEFEKAPVGATPPKVSEAPKVYEVPKIYEVPRKTEVGKPVDQGEPQAASKVEVRFLDGHAVEIAQAQFIWEYEGSDVYPAISPPSRSHVSDILYVVRIRNDLTESLQWPMKELARLVFEYDFPSVDRPRLYRSAWLELATGRRLAGDYYVRTSQRLLMRNTHFVRAFRSEARLRVGTISLSACSHSNPFSSPVLKVLRLTPRKGSILMRTAKPL